MLPASFMCWMIYRTDGEASPYYAGLNLVLLVVPSRTPRTKINLDRQRTML